MLEGIEENLGIIKLIYKNASEERRKYIKDWLEGIVLDKDEGDGYLGIKFDGENITATDEETDEEINLEDLKENELWQLAGYLEDLLEELRKGEY